jgi:two-component system response regulator HydG
MSNGGSILVIDDEEAILHLMEFHLASKYRCATVPSAEAAFQLLEKDCFQVVLTDIKLPGASGFDVCEFVRTHCPQTVMMMMTGMQGALYARRAIEAGVFSFVTKPIEFAQLLRLIDEALRHQALRQQARAAIRQPGKVQ